MKLEQEKDVPGGIKTNTAFVVHVENTLGFVIDPDKPAWKARSIEAGKLKRKREQKPKLYSMDNLLLTVEYLRQQKREVKSPAAVCFFVEEALERALKEPTPSELDDLMGQILDSEPDGSEWHRRAVRSRGVEARRELYVEWHRHKHGEAPPWAR